MERIVCAKSRFEQKSKSIDSGQERVSIANCLCRECYTRYMGRTQITITHLRKIRDNQHDGKSHIKQLSTSTFEQMRIMTFHKLREERGLTLENTRKGTLLYLARAVELRTKSKHPRKSGPTRKNRQPWH